jgi:iron complex transport system ATP-binding protein
MIISVRGVSFSYASREVLQNICFTVSRGDCLAVMGTNGAGKSTLLKCINRILKPQRGVILVQKDDVHRLSRTEVARRMGYVGQRHESGGRFTVFDAVLLGRKPYIRWDASSQDMAVVNRILELMDLDSFALRYLDELSGGEAQKVVIARALAQEPEVLLLDEPTSNLDLRNQLEVLKIIRDAVQEREMAAIVTMHDLNLALRFADRFLFLKEGSVFAAGDMEVMTPENIEQVYSVPVAVEKLQSIPVVVPL